MKRKEFLNIVRKEVHYVYDRESIENELNDHIEDSINDLMDEGLLFEEAEEVALQQMGDPKELGKLLNKEHNPIVGYLWQMSKLFVIVLVIPGVLFGCMMIYSLYHTIIPSLPRDADIVYEVNEVIQTPSTKIIIDYYSCDEEKSSFTIRYIKNRFYSRSGWNCLDVQLLDSKGEYLGIDIYGNSSHLLGNSSQYNFLKPNDNIIVVKTYNGQTKILNLEDYIYE